MINDVLIMASYFYQIIATNILLQLLNKMISQKVQQFKQFMKLKLLNPYRDYDNFRQMVESINSSNVNNYNWKSQEEKQWITERILFIEKLTFVLEEEKRDFQINYLIGENTEISQFINYKGFIQLLVEKNKSIKADDFNGLQGFSKDQIKKVQQHLLKNNDFKKWCEKYSSNVAIQTPSNHNNVNFPPHHQGTTNENTTTKDSFEQDYQRAIAVNRMSLSDSQKREINKQRRQYLQQKVKLLQKQYSKHVLQLKLINLELDFLKNPQYQMPVNKLRKMLEEENKLDMESIKQKFQSYHANGVSKIDEVAEIREISKLLTPLDTYKIKVAASNTIAKQKAALMIIGDSGVGKSTLILRLLDYELKSQKVNKIDTLVTTTKAKPQHQNLIASQSLQSVTQNLSAYQLKFKKLSIALIDSPGFNDTGGEEVDISNQISLQKAYENCDSICYLFLIDISKLKGERCVMVVALARNIATRFVYKTLDELENMLLLVFNKKLDYRGDLELMNLPRASVDLLKQCSYRLTDKEKIALKLISQRLNNQWSLFDPFREVEHIKSDIQRLTFKTPNRIMRKIDKNFENKVMQFNNILEKNIHYYLQARRIDVAKYHYDQLAILQKTVAQESTKTRKKILDSSISIEVARIEDKIRQILIQKISTLVAKNQQLEELAKLLTDVRPFTQILNLKSSMDRINQEINNVFQTIVSFINNKATDQNISTVTRICGFFLNLGNMVVIKQKNIEKIYSQELMKLPKQIKHKYKTNNCLQFDTSFKSYITYYKFYQSFSSTLPQQFSKIKQIKDPQEIKNEYMAKEEEKYKLFADSLSELEQHFIHNSTLNTQSIQKLNSYYENALQFKQSIYISLASKIQQRQTSSKQYIDNRCIVYTQEFEKILQFKMSQSHSNSRNQVKSLMDNLYIIKNTLKIDSILNITNRTHQVIVKNVANVAQQFSNKFKEAIANINNLELKQDYTIFTFIKDKLSLLQIFEEAKHVTTQYESFKNTFIEFSNILKKSLNPQLKSNKSEDMKIIFQRIKSLGRYEKIDEQLDQLIHSSQSFFEQKVKTYMQDLKQKITIKEIRSISDYKIFNAEYIRTMKKYIDGVLSYSYDEASVESLHEQIYWINYKSLQNIDSLIDLCILCGKHQELFETKQQTQENSKLLLKLREKYQFVGLLGQIYENLRAINDKYLLYIKNELYSFKVSRNINIEQMIRKIEYFPQDRQQHMSAFLATTNKFILSSTNVDGYKRIRIDKCTQFLQQTSQIKRLITKMVFATQDTDFSKWAQEFVKIENDLNILVATYHEKQMNRIQKAINIQTLVIPYMQQCQKLYNELKSGCTIVTDTQNISTFIDRLERFVHRKVEIYEKTLDSCEDTLGHENISHLNESIYFNQIFSRFIPKSDVLRYNISLFQKLDMVIKSISQQVEKAIEDKLKMLEQKIQQRNFEHVDQELARLQKISNKIRDHFTHEINKHVSNGTTQQNLVVEHYQLTKIKTIIEKLESIKYLRLNQTKLDIEIAEHPFEGYNKFKLQEVYTHSKKGEVQHRIRQKIQSVFKQLLNKYLVCQYSNSNKIGKEICDNLPYIPHELSKNYDFKIQYEQLKDKKLKRERIEMDKLKSKDITANNNNLNKIITKYNEFSLNDNLQMKEQAFDLIKTELNLIVSEVIRADDIVGMIDIASQKFWSLIYKFTINNEDIFTLDLSTYFMKIEDQIVQTFAKIVTKSLNNLTSNVNDEQIANVNIQQIQKQTKNACYFDKTFAEQKKKVHFDQKYKKIVTFIQQNIKDIAKNFDVVCPLGKIDEALNGEGLNAKKAKKLMKKCLIKSAIYSIIFSFFNSFDTPSSSLNPSGMEIQPDSNSASITNKIKNFRDKIDNNIKYLKGQLLGIQFQNYAKQNQSKEKIEALLLKADKQATLLEIYEQNLTSGSFGHDFEQTNFQSIVKSIQNKLNNFVSKFLNSLNDSINDLEKDIPSELYFLQMLLEKISTNCCRKIFDNLAVEEKESMGEESYFKFAINPTKEFNNYIETCLQKLRPILKDARLSFCRVQKEQEILRKELKTMQESMQESLNSLYREYQKQLNSISENNEGKSQDQIDHKLQEASTQFELDRQSQQKKWNERGDVLTKKHQDETKQVKKNYASMLLNLKKLQFNFHSSNSAKAKLAEMIKTELDEIKKANALRLLSQNLDEYNYQNYTYLLKSNTPHFKYEQILQFNKKTQAQDIKYVTNQLKNLYFILEARYINSKDKINLTKVKDELFYQYNQFKKYYFSLLKENESDLQNKMEFIISKYKQGDRIQRLAIILAVWSLNEKSKNSDSDIQLNNQEGQSLAINPHPVQVTALLILTRTNTSNQFCSQLVQILTGQGKSIVLAALAIYIAKTQANVVVSCYSSYLCQRDLKNFQVLFTKFKVSHLIAYNTFNEICEKVLNNPDKNTQKKITQVLMNKPSTGDKSIGATISKKTVLLIDEVDVFFEKQYFGSTYRPVLKLNDQVSKDFIRFAFNQLEKNNKVMANDLAKSQQFKKLIALYPKLETILKNQLNRMKYEYLHPEVKYFIDQKMVKYMDKDKLSQKLHFGYETIFAYCRQYKNGKISPQNYENSLFIPLIYGEFSYSELPKCYSAIIGLSGTIQHLPLQKINYLVKQYKIDKRNMYILPSIYGPQHAKIEAFTIQSEKTYYKYLIQKINVELAKGRPVLVCFKNYTQLQKFYKSKAYIQSKLKSATLHEHLDNDLRDKCIMTVGTLNRLTAMTAAFSRGTDFIISDKKIKKNGGLHLILTYVPELRSQFIQFRGRTGRQGQEGSIHTIITEAEAKEKGIACEYEDDILANFVKYMDRVSKSEDEQNKKRLEQSFKNHVQTQKYMENISKSTEEYSLFLYSLNKCIIRKETPTKIIIGIDGTNSMQKTFEELINQMKIIMLRIIQIINAGSMNGSFLVQIVVYRNYNTAQKILIASDFQENLQKLLPFLKKITVEGGMGNEAIQLLYRHINIQGDVDMVILIGDAPPNTELEVKKNRKDEDWQKFAKSRSMKENLLYETTNCNEEEKKFPQNIIINGLYINGNKFVELNSAERYFKQIANRHFGEAKELNFSKSDYSQNLIEFFTTKILAAVNGNENSERINQLYRDRFRSYTS